MKGQDVIVALRLSRTVVDETYADLASELFMSASEVHAATRRLQAAGLLTAERRLLAAPFLEFVEHGLRYVFPVKPGPRSVGVSTAHSAPPLDDLLVADEPLVWPFPSGPDQGAAVEPLYRSVPQIALADSGLHEMLALVDALRLGRARDRKLALDELTGRLRHDRS